MTKDELIATADDACVFTNDLQVVPLKYALQAIVAEREACAKVCDEQAKDPECPERAGYCADAIRMRSNMELRGATDEPKQ